MKPLSQQLREAIVGVALSESELEYFGGFEGGPDVPNPTGEKPWPEEHRSGRETAATEPVPLVPGALVVVRTKDGVRVAEGFIEDVMHETRVVRVRDSSSGADIQIDVDTDRYDVWVMDPEIVGDAPNPDQETGYVRPSRPGPRKGGISGGFGGM